MTHITIAFYEKAHGDGENFDGPGMKFFLSYFLQSFLEFYKKKISVTLALGQNSPFLLIRVNLDFLSSI